MKIKLNKKFKPLFTSKDRYFIVTGGRGSSKSFSITTYLLLLMMGESGHTILFTRYTMTSAHLSIIPEFLEKIELLNQQDNFYITKDSIENKLTGSKILFKGIRTSSGEQTASLKSLNGVTTWVLDEAEELMNEKIFDKINLSVRANNKQNRIILILNPATKIHWIYKRFFQNNEVEPSSNLSKNNVTYIHTTYLDNKKHLAPSFIKEIENLKESNIDKYNTTILGGWMNQKEGVVFKDWKQINEIPKEAILVGYGADFGHNHPTTCVAVYKLNESIILDELLYERHLSTGDITNRFKALNLKANVFCDSAMPAYIQELRNANISAYPVKKIGESITFGINLMLDYPMLVTKNSINLINELNNYSWLESNDGSSIDKPAKVMDDLIDAARYCYIMRLQHKSSTPMVSF